MKYVKYIDLGQSKPLKTKSISINILLASSTKIVQKLALFTMLWHRTTMYTKMKSVHSMSWNC